MSDETLACVECGQACAPKDMYGAKGDRRCEPCAKGIRQRMDPTRTHSLVATSTGTRKAKKQKQTLIMGGLFAVALVVAWAVSDRTPDAVPVDLGPPVQQVTPQMRLFGQRPFPPTSGIAAVGSLQAPQALARRLPAAVGAWARHAIETGRSFPDPTVEGGARRSSWAAGDYRRGVEQLSLFLVDGGRTSDLDQELFRAACNVTCAGLPAAAYSDGERVRVRLLIANRFWLDARGPTRKAVEALLASVDLAGLKR